jgi:hypothetical protein
MEQQRKKGGGGGGSCERGGESIRPVHWPKLADRPSAHCALECLKAAPWQPHYHSCPPHPSQQVAASIRRRVTTGTAAVERSSRRASMVVRRDARRCPHTLGRTTAWPEERELDDGARRVTTLARALD